MHEYCQVHMRACMHVVLHAAIHICRYMHTSCMCTHVIECIHAQNLRGMSTYINEYLHATYTHHSLFAYGAVGRSMDQSVSQHA